MVEEVDVEEVAVEEVAVEEVAVEEVRVPFCTEMRNIWGHLTFFGKKGGKNRFPPQKSTLFISVF